MGTELVPELMVNSVSRSLAFYQDKLDFQLVDVAPAGADPRWAELARGDYHLMMQGEEEMKDELPVLRDRAPGGSCLLVLRLETKEAVRTMAGRLGDGDVVMPLRETDYGTTEVGVCDPDGYVIIISGRDPE